MPAGKAKSKKQQRFFGMVHAIQKGTLDPSKVSDKMRKVASKMKYYQSFRDFAATKHKGLPMKVRKKKKVKRKEIATEIMSAIRSGKIDTSNKKVRFQLKLVSELLKK